MEGFGISLADICIIVATSIAAGAVRGFSGFGSALVITPILSLLVGPRMAVPAVALAHIVTTAQLLPGTRGVVSWPRIIPLSIAGSVCVPLGVFLLISLDQDLVRRSISVVILAFTVAMFAGWRYTGPANPILTMGVGGLGGMLTGAASIGGPPVIVFLLAGSDRAATNRATFIYYFLFIQLVSIPVFWLSGILDQGTLLLFALMTPSMMIGLWAGEKIFRKSSEEIFRRVALSFLLIIGLTTLVL